MREACVYAKGKIKEKLVLGGISGNYNNEETSFKIGILEKVK